VDEWGFIWIMFILKIPLVALLWLVWWAVRATEDAVPEQDGDDGGSKLPRHPRTDPRRPRTRGPHGEPPVPAPPRVRTAALAREHEREPR
jgi:hypothetical protein